MGAGVSGKGKERPYRIIGLMTIWSFLTTQSIAQACPHYFSKSISPPSRLSSMPRIIKTEDGLCVVEDGSAAIDECRDEARFVYTNLFIEKSLKDRKSIAEIRNELSRYCAGRFDIENIPNEDGIILTYQKSACGKNRHTHYFLRGDSLCAEALGEDGYMALKNKIEVAFSPEGGCADEFEDAIDCAQNTLEAAMYRLKNAKIYEALKRAVCRGVAVRLILNDKKVSGVLGGLLEDGGAQVKYYTGKDDPAYKRFAVIDKARILTGTYDWTEAAEKESRENLIMIPYAPDFLHEFDYLWDNKERPPPRAHSPPQRVTALFSLKSECEREILKLIDKAIEEQKSHPESRISIKLALYSFTGKDIAKKLFEAKENGVDVEIILDRSRKSSGRKTEKYLLSLEKKSARGRPRGLLSIKYYRIMHGMMRNRFAIIGDTTVTGSYDWSGFTLWKDRASLILMPGAVKGYLAEFDNLRKDSFEKTIIDNGTPASTQGKESSPDASSQPAEKIGRPIEIQRLIQETVELFIPAEDIYKSSGTDPPPGQWSSDAREAAKDEPYSKWEKKAEVFKISACGEQYVEATKEEGDEIVSSMNENDVNSFGEDIRFLKAEKDLIVYRFFDSHEGCRGKSQETGPYFACEDFETSASDVNRILNLDGYNDAVRKLKCIIKKGTIFVFGRVIGGSADQVFVPRHYLNKVLFFPETREKWDDN